ncbi:uncharacterized protein LOC141502760 [Macrotis lagotis]|uniref:uncharacterized protein LOC141502760 n=1 Tax=Macrotis lagotis TaxID=92651 RepID=UPI003D68E3DA
MRKGRGRGRGRRAQVPNTEPLLPPDSRDNSESSFQGHAQKGVSVSCPPTAPLVAEFHSAGPKELPIMAEPQLQMLQRQKQGSAKTGGQDHPGHSLFIPRKRSETFVQSLRALQSQIGRVGESSGSLTDTQNPSCSLMYEPPTPQATRGQKAGAVVTPGSTVKVQPKLQHDKWDHAVKESSPCPKRRRRGRPRKQPTRKDEEDEKPVGFETAVNPPVGFAETAVQPKEEVKERPHRRLGRPRLSHEIRAIQVWRGIMRTHRSLWSYSQKEKQAAQALLVLAGCQANPVSEASDILTEE